MFKPHPLPRLAMVTTSTYVAAAGVMPCGVFWALFLPLACSPIVALPAIAGAAWNARHRTAPTVAAGGAMMPRPGLAPPARARLPATIRIGRAPPAIARAPIAHVLPATAASRSRQQQDGWTGRWPNSDLSKLEGPQLSRDCSRSHRR
jgi:hypothetical protein